MRYNDFSSMPFTLTVKDVCDTLSISLSKGYALVSSGKLPALKLGASYRIPRDALIKFIKEEIKSA